MCIDTIQIKKPIEDWVTLTNNGCLYLEIVANKVQQREYFRIAAWKIEVYV